MAETKGRQCRRYTKTANYTVSIDDDVILADASGGAFTITLPPAADAYKPVLIIRINSGGNKPTVTGNGSETINGHANVKLGAQYAKAWVISDGSNWFVGGEE